VVRDVGSFVNCESVSEDRCARSIFDKEVLYLE
jgi:hypothetical protein